MLVTKSRLTGGCQTQRTFPSLVRGMVSGLVNLQAKLISGTGAGCRAGYADGVMRNRLELVAAGVLEGTKPRTVGYMVAT